MAKRKKGIYPTMDEVEAATYEQLSRWYRFLPSPAAYALHQPDEVFRVALEREKAILDRIVERFREHGGMTAGMSKRIGLG